MESSEIYDLYEAQGTIRRIMSWTPKREFQGKESDVI